MHNLKDLVLISESKRTIKFVTRQLPPSSKKERILTRVDYRTRIYLLFFPHLTRRPQLGPPFRRSLSIMRPGSS